MPLSSAHRLILFQAVDAKVPGHGEAFYGALNEHYRTRGILPGFRVYPNVRIATPPVSERRAKPSEAPSGTTEAAQDHIGVLDGLRQLLAQRVEAGRGAGFAPGRLASDDELQTALLALQGHVAEVADAAQREIRSAQALRDELLVQLNRGRPAGSPPAELTAEQNDTVELTAMLFESLGQQIAAALSGQQTVDAALEGAQKQVERDMTRAGYIK